MEFFDLVDMHHHLWCISSSLLRNWSCRETDVWFLSAESGWQSKFWKNGLDIASCFYKVKCNDLCPHKMRNVDLLDDEQDLNDKQSWEKIMGRKALCVGINNFKNFPGSALQGCVNDAEDMSILLQELLGFTGGDITTLTDADATKANIMQNLETMVDEAKAGKHNYLVFSLSSHGTQVPDLSGDEDDAADEAFCPHDLAQDGNKWDPNFIITDDELHDLFVTLPANVLLEVYLDTCHSGTGVRAIDFLLTRKPRYMPPPSLEAFKQIEGRVSRGLSRKFIEQKTAVHHILWSGCRADQTSADALIEETWHGAFTYYFCKEMHECQNQLSRKKVMNKVRKDLADGHYSQVPQLECEATKRNESVA